MFKYTIRSDDSCPEYIPAFYLSARHEDALNLCFVDEDGAEQVLLWIDATGRIQLNNNVALGMEYNKNGFPITVK